MNPPTVPAAPSALRNIVEPLKPEDYNPDIAAAKMAQELVRQMGAPAIVSKEFVVRKGIWEGLNHRYPMFDGKGIMIDPGNPTGYDCSLRIAIYNNVSKNSVNIDGKYFMAIWQYLMKPKYTIVQAGQQPDNSFDEQPSLGRRLLNKLTGGGNTNATTGPGK